jgi:hypothetical protein
MLTMLQRHQPHHVMGCSKMQNKERPASPAAGKQHQMLLQAATELLASPNQLAGWMQMPRQV